MRTLTMERVQQLDAAHGAEVRDFVRHIRLSTVFHEDNVESILAMAERMGVALEELSTYVWLQAYVRELRDSCDDTPPPVVAAQQFGLSPAELDAYVGGRADTMTAEEHRDYLEDLQEDAALQGD